MAVYRRGFQRYNGPLTTHADRLLVMPRFAWDRLLSQRFVLIVLVLSLFWPLLCACYIYLSNHSELWQGMDQDVRKMLIIDGNFFSIFMNVQSVFALILAAIAGPGLIAPDLANNALPLYFSRPLTRGDYILSRMIVLIGILSLVTLVPGLLLFAMEAGMAGGDWILGNWYLGTGVFIGFALWILTLSLVAMTCSAYVKWRVVAGALVLAFFFLLTGAAEMVNAIFRVDWGSMFNPAYAMWAIWCTLLGVELPENKPGAAACGFFIVFLIGALLTVLARKLRPVEVVS